VFVKENGLEAPIQALLDLVSEVGEVSKEVLKGTSYGLEPFQPREQWAEELADVFSISVREYKKNAVALLHPAYRGWHLSRRLCQRLATRFLPKCAKTVA